VNDARKSESTIEAYQKQLLGGVPYLTALEVANRAASSVDVFDKYWLAMGFPPTDPDDAIFTDADVDAFRSWVKMVDDGMVRQTAALSLIRAQSHLADRLALWQVEALVEDTERRLGLDDTSARLVTIDEMEDFVPGFEQQLVYTWRRHMQDLLSRSAHEVAHRPADHSKKRFPLTRTLGFVDMVAYTSKSGQMGDHLVDFIERFEYVCRSAVTEKGGRVVKMIGDAVFFIADDLETGVQVATHLMETLEQTEGILPVRASIVQGDVFSRSGDVFGPPVNLAARLVDISPPGRILTDAPTAAAIEAGHGGSGVSVSEFPRSELRGLGRVSPYLLRWK